MQKMKVKYTVVDSGPIIKGANLSSFSEHAIIVPGVIREIKDLKTRERIRNLPPYFLSIQVPSEKSIKHVKLVAIKTGDIKVLSPIDIEVLAMSYELKYLKTSEEIEKIFESLVPEEDIIDLDIIEEAELEDDNQTDDEITVTDDDTASESEISTDVENFENDSSQQHENVDSFTDVSNLSTDNEGWITPENFEEMRKTNFGFSKNDDGLTNIEELEDIPLIGCLTTDYAMQNVLLHMNVTILSVNGMIVKEPRIFVTYCRVCFHKYRRVDIFFCPHCGNDNVGKVPAKISENGEMQLFLKKDFQPNLRNKIFSIPNPKGGKHTDGTHYIYCADQRVPDERPKKNKIIVDIGEDGQLPFVCHDFTTKSSLRGIRNDQTNKLRPSVPRGNKNNNRRRRK